MSHPTHEQIVEVKRRDPSLVKHHRVRVTVNLADIARRYGPRAVCTISGKCRFLEGGVIIEDLGPWEPPAL
jgi:hypothetical protein